MGWGNPPIRWSEFERKLSGRRRPDGPSGPPPEADGGDSPAWSPHRPAYDPPEELARPPESPVTPYAELHTHSNFSFLDGASHPEELVEEAVRLGVGTLALTDHDGLYGVARLAEAADTYNERHGAGTITTVIGAELSLGLTAPQNGVPDPEGTHLLVLARGEEGYHQLAGAITDGQLAGEEKGRPIYDLDALAERGRDRWVILTGCRKGTVPHALRTGGPAAADRELCRLVELFGPDAVYVELTDHGHPLDSETNDALAALAAARGLPTIATGNVHYHAPRRRALATTIAAIRARRSLDEIDGWLPAAGTAHLRSGAEMAALFACHPDAVARTVRLADELAFPLLKAKPELPLDDDPNDPPMRKLRRLTEQGMERRFARRDIDPKRREAYEQRMEQELDVIESLGFPGYFLIVEDIVRFAVSKGILCQGRGSAASSIVCYFLGITAVDAVHYGLPFARFLAENRGEAPDIDVDFDSDRREEVIQYVYRRYDRRHAAQVANVITYRPKLAVRDVAKAFGHSTGQQDAWSKRVDSWGEVTPDGEIPEAVTEMAKELLGFPRHLGIHSGGMVLTRRPVGEVCPIEHARMEGRTILQWDKDCCETMGLVKFDLLGLGMLAALSYTFGLVRDRLGETWTLESIPKEEPGVYDMLCAADTIGVFQVESRAQMATLPRLRPRSFYDLVIEIALIRPGPIQGGAVHPFIRRKNGEEEDTPPHHLLEDVLRRTKGVPLFQEQLMQMAIEVGGFSEEQADQLRRAMGSKRGKERIGALKDKLYDGMAANGITGELADELYDKIEAFANFGFAESHSISFALLVYASSWLRLHYPSAFLAALLRAQPMGFYSPQSLVADARRHGVVVRPPDIHVSGVHPTLEPVDGSGLEDRAPRGNATCLDRPQPEIGDYDPDRPVDHAAHRRDDDVACRLGLASVNSISVELAERIVDERDRGGRYVDQADLARRVGLTAAQLEALATADAFAGLGLHRREALWLAGGAAQERPDQLAGIASGQGESLEQMPLLEEMQPAEKTMADLWSMSMSPAGDPVQHLRGWLDGKGVIPARRLNEVENGRRVYAAGVVTHRQRPATASGVTFMNLEDETGLVNVICPMVVWNRQVRVARESSALIVRGTIERVQGVTNVYAEKFERLPITAKTTSRDFH